MKDREQQILNDVIKRLKATFNPAKIILFGSRAKGKAVVSSDFDLAVQCKKTSDLQKTKMKDQIDKICGLYKVDVIYWDEVDDDFRKIITQTGKVIYERGA